MKTLKTLSTYLKDNIKTHRLNISYLKNEKGKVSFTNGHYLIVTQNKEAESLPELFNVDVKKMIGETKDQLVNGCVVKSPADSLNAMDYPQFEPILERHEKSTKTITISLNAEYLANIAKIVSKNGTTATLEITDDVGTIKITGDVENSFGIMMPMKVK